MIDILSYELINRPEIPKKICDNELKWKFGIISPSLLFSHYYDNDIVIFLFDTKRYLLYKRQLNKNDYKDLYRSLRIEWQNLKNRNDDTMNDEENQINE